MSKVKTTLRVLRALLRLLWRGVRAVSRALVAGLSSMDEDALVGLLALLMFGSLIAGISIGYVTLGNGGAWTGLIVVVGLWIGGFVANLFRVMRRGAAEYAAEQEADENDDNDEEEVAA